jgi:hypothetical protein
MRRNNSAITFVYIVSHIYFKIRRKNSAIKLYISTIGNIPDDLQRNIIIIMLTGSFTHFLTTRSLIMQFNYQHNSQQQCNSRIIFTAFTIFFKWLTATVNMSYIFRKNKQLTSSPKKEKKSSPTIDPSINP